MVGGPGTHPPGWVQCNSAPATPDSPRTADREGFYLARIIRDQRSRIMRARLINWNVRQEEITNTGPRHGNLFMRNAAER